MGDQVSKEVFKDQIPTYDLTFPGLMWIKCRKQGDQQIAQKKIPAIFYEWKDEGEGKREPNFTLIYVPGPETDMGVWNRWLRELSYLLKANILSFDYTGRGLNQGQASEKQWAEDLLSAYAFLRIEKNIDANRIIFYGRGLGTGPVVRVAASLSIASKAHRRTQRGSALFDRMRRKNRFDVDVPDYLLSPSLARQPSASSQELASLSSENILSNTSSPHLSPSPSFVQPSQSQKVLLDAHARSISSPRLHALADDYASPLSEEAIVPLAGVILQSPMTSILALVKGATGHDLFENIRFVDKISSPICMLHGTNDEVIPI